jgi:hypothetical protein
MELWAATVDGETPDLTLGLYLTEEGARKTHRSVMPVTVGGDMDIFEKLIRLFQSGSRYDTWDENMAVDHLLERAMNGDSEAIVRLETAKEAYERGMLALQQSGALDFLD